MAILAPSLAGGGAERIAVNLSNHYAGKGIDVVLIVFSSNGPYRKQVNPMVRVLDLNTRIRSAFFRLFLALSDEKPDFVISVMRSSNIVLGCVSYFLNIKSIYREANTMNAVLMMPFFKRFFYKTLMKLSYRKSFKVIANSSDTKKDLLVNSIVSDDKIRVIGNPVLPENLEFLSNDKIDPLWLKDEECSLILNVGRLHIQKNQALLLRAFSKAYKENSTFRLLILGEGEELVRLNDLARSLNIDHVIKILPFTSNPYPFYKIADVFVLSSSWEGFGNVIVEAMACRTKVVSTNCPGGPKTILNNGEFGVLVECDNEDALALAIVKSLGSNDKALIESAYHRSLEFGIPYIASLYYELATGKKLL